MTLTAVSCALAVITIPVTAFIVEHVWHHAMAIAVPFRALVTQVLLAIALPIGTGMAIRALARRLGALEPGPAADRALVFGASPADRFTLSTEFATRNVAIATALALALGGFDLALFGALLRVRSADPARRGVRVPPRVRRARARGAAVIEGRRVHARPRGVR